MCVCVALSTSFPTSSPGIRSLSRSANPIEDGGLDRHQIARDQDGLIDDLVAVPGFQGQGRCRHRALDVPGDPGVHLTRERDRPIGRDADGRTPDMQFGSPAFDEPHGHR